MLQAEFSMLDFKSTEDSFKVVLPLYIEVKGKRIKTGCGSLTVCTLPLFMQASMPSRQKLACIALCEKQYNSLVVLQSSSASFLPLHYHP